VISNRRASVAPLAAIDVSCALPPRCSGSCVRAILYPKEEPGEAGAKRKNHKGWYVSVAASIFQAQTPPA
jgi:hypothetical protein